MPFVRPARFYRFNQVQAAPPPPPPPPSSGESLITVLTVSETGTGAKTNEIVEFGIPLGSGVMTSVRYVSIKDDDGVGATGATLGLFQVDNRTTDRFGSVRFEKVTAIVPSLGNGATRKLRVYSTDTSAPNGQPITVADITALSAAADGMFKVTCDISGDAHTISVNDILTGGSANYNKASFWICSSQWRSGPLCSEFRLMGAPRFGGTAHLGGDGIQVEFHMSAYKAGSSNVSAGNPITAIKCDTLMRNADAVRASASTLYYGWKLERATALDDPTLITSNWAEPNWGPQKYNYERKAISGSASFTGLSAGVSYSMASEGSTLDPDIMGAHILEVGGPGKAVIRTRTNSAAATLYIYNQFSTVGFTAGKLMQEGVGHVYGTEFIRRAWVGNAPSNLHIWGNVQTATSANTRSPMEYLASSEIVMPYGATHVSCTYDLAELNRFIASSDSTIRPLTIRGDYAFNTYHGNILQFIDAASQRADIGPLPDWQVMPFIRFNSSARRYMWENAHHYGMHQWRTPIRLSGSPTTGALATPPRKDSDKISHWKGQPAAELVGVTNQLNTPDGLFNIFSNDLGHHTADFFMPYVYSGDYYWLQRVQSYAERTGYGPMSETPFGNNADSTPLACGQTRAAAWRHRDRLYAAVATPDVSRPFLYNDKSYQISVIDSAMSFVTGTKGFGHPWFSSGRPIHFTGEGSIFGAVDGIGSARFKLDGFWQQAFISQMIGYTYFAGMQNSDTSAVAKRLANTWNELAAETSASGHVRDMLATSYFVTFHTTNDASLTTSPDTIVCGGRPDDWAKVYQRSCWNGPANSNGWNFVRNPTGTVTIDNPTSGAGRILTFPTSSFAGGGTGTGAWYVNGTIRQGDGEAGSDSRYGVITNVLSGRGIVASLVQSFTTAAVTANGLWIPGPHPDDYDGNSAAAGYDYPQIVVAAARLIQRSGNACSAMVTFQTGRSGYKEDNIKNHFLDIA